MRLIGLTGGIASGKSTVAGMLAERGAVVIDADQIARDVVRPGRPAYERIIERFGPDVLAPDDSIDRGKLASIVFGDPDALASLNAMTHPDVAREMAEQIESRRGSDVVVVVDVPLLVEAGMAGGFDAVLVVTASPGQQVERLARERGMPAEAARARIAAQASEEAKRAVATHVIDNLGSLSDLQSKVDDFWREIAPR